MCGRCCQNCGTKPKDLLCVPERVTQACVCVAVQDLPERWLCLQCQMVCPQPGSSETIKREDQWRFGRANMKEPPLTASGGVTRSDQTSQTSLTHTGKQTGSQMTKLYCITNSIQ